MGGFDPFTAAPAWRQDLAFAGSSWSGSGTSALHDLQELEFHIQNGRAKETVSAPELDEQFLQDYMTFQVDNAVEGALMVGTLGFVPALNTPSMLRSSSNISGSEEAQFVLGEQQVPTPNVWPSAYSQISSFIGDQQTFGFGTLSSGDLEEACSPDGKKCHKQGNVSSAPLQLHGGVTSNNGTMLSFAPGQNLNRKFDNLQIGQKEFSGLDHSNLSSLVSGQLAAFNATGAALSPKQSNEVRSGINGLTGTSIARSEAPNGNAAAVSGAPKPRVRARRGQATDPHSIAERLRREKISDRMKDLQELVPNSNKTDKASMLDEIIDYVKFLQLQVKVLSMSRLGAAEAVVPLLAESQTKRSGLLLPPKSESRKAGEDVLEHSEFRDGAAFEQEVAQLMENNMTTAMQYLQSKGLCLMPIALASAMSDKKGTSSAAVRPENGGTAGYAPREGSAGRAEPFWHRKGDEVQSFS